MCVSELLLSIGDEALDAYSRVLIKLAAQKGHSVAQRIDSNYKPNVEIEREIQEEMEIEKRKIEKAPAPTASPSTEARAMQAQLKTFGSNASSPSVSLMNHHQQVEEAERSPFSLGNSK